MIWQLRQHHAAIRQACTVALGAWATAPLLALPSGAIAPPSRPVRGNPTVANGSWLDPNVQAMAPQKLAQTLAQTKEEQDCPTYIRRCPTRGDLTPWHSVNVPYIVSPRWTYLADRQPALRWNPVVGATQYSVSLEDGTGHVVFEQVTTEPNVPAGVIEPPLTPGIYTMRVQANTGQRSSEAPRVPGGIGFQVVTAEVAAGVDAEVANLAAQMPPGAARSLAIAQAYFDRGFNLDGIQTLEAAIAAGEATPAIYRTLATVSWERLVLVEAQAAYAGLLEVAVPDSQDRAIALWGLGRSAAVLGDRATAQGYLEQARDLYQTLGDTATASKIESQLRELTQNLTPENTP